MARERLNPKRFFQRGNLSKSTVPPEEAITLAERPASPAWASATSIFQVLPNGLRDEPQEGQSWQARSGELVKIGDMVALMISQELGTVGRITAKTDDGKAECLIIRGRTNLIGKSVEADAEQLLVRVWS